MVNLPVFKKRTALVLFLSLQLLIAGCKSPGSPMGGGGGDGPMGGGGGGQPCKKCRGNGGQNPEGIDQERGAQGKKGFSDGAQIFDQSADSTGLTFPENTFSRVPTNPQGIGGSILHNKFDSFGINAPLNKDSIGIASPIQSIGEAPINNQNIQSPQITPIQNQQLIDRTNENQVGDSLPALDPSAETHR